MSLFKDQTNATIKLDTKIDLSGASYVGIDYKKPDGISTGSWEGTAEGTQVVYEVVSGDLNQVGVYTLQAKTVIDAKTAKGEIVQLTVSKPLI